MSAQRAMDMRKFFSSVTKKELHRANMHVQRFHDEEKSQKIAEAQQNFRKEIADEISCRES